MPELTPHPGPLLLRLTLYGGLQLGALYVHLLLTTEHGAAFARAYLAEGSWLEWTQAGLIMLALVLVLAKPGRRDTIRLLIACLLIAALARELDAYFTKYMVKRGHRVVMVAAALAAAALAWQRRATLAEDLTGFLRRPGFYLMLMGMCLAAIYGTVLGQNAMWLEASAEGYDRINKRFVEEGLEASGYLWVLFGVLEEVVFRRAPDTQ